MVADGILILSILVGNGTMWLIARASVRAALIAGFVIFLMGAVDMLFASHGVLSDWTRRPPPFMVAVAFAVLLAIVTGLSRLGARVAAAASMAQIIAVQTFRLPLELVMHHAASIGLMPVQMSYSGRNF